MAYTEDHLIEQPAIQLFEHELGWDSVNAYDDPPPLKLRRTGWAVEEELTQDRSVLSLGERQSRDPKTAARLSQGDDSRSRTRWAAGGCRAGARLGRCGGDRFPAGLAVLEFTLEVDFASR